MGEVIGIISVALAIIVIIQAHRNHKFSKLVAAHQGVFRKPNLLVRIYGQKFLPDYFIFACNIHSKRTIFMPLLIGLHNIGNKSAEKVVIHIHSPKRLKGGVKAEGLKIKAPKTVSYDVLEENNFIRTITEIGTIHPKQRCEIHDFFSIKEKTFLDFSVDAVSKNGTKMRTDIRVEYCNLIEYVIYFDDLEPIFGLIKILIIDTSEQSLKEFISLRNQRKKEKYREEIGNYIKQIFHFLKLKYIGKKTIQKFQLLRYDESKIIRHSDVPVDEVPIDAIRICDGFEDIQGCLCIPALGI